MNKSFDRLNVAVLGTGSIGTDLLMKIKKSPYLLCSYFVGRNQDSQGINIAKEMGIKTSYDGIDALINASDKYDLVFDATSALDHPKHAEVLFSLRKKIINLTASKLGKIYVPAINPTALGNENHINLITCGGQAATPIAYALSKVHKNIDYIETIASISSKSAGLATRRNIDEYIISTEHAIKAFSQCKEAKSILNLNPAVPEVNMKMTLYAQITNPDLPKITQEIHSVIKRIIQYMPKYRLLVPPCIENGHVAVIIEVKGQGDYLPEYAGNLDIITCAAIKAAENICKIQKAPPAIKE